MIDVLESVFMSLEMSKIDQLSTTAYADKHKRNRILRGKKTQKEFKTEHCFASVLQVKVFLTLCEKSNM